MYQESLRAFLKPVLQWLDDPSVSEIMINGPDDIWIEAKGKLTKTTAKFTDEDGLQAAARNMAQYVGRMLNAERPRLDARLPDGSRIHIVIPPIARKGTTISIRKFFSAKLGIDMLIKFGSMTPQMARFIEACVIVKENIIVAGGTGSGKTTLLNVVSTLIPADERILTIEDSAELQLQQDHIVPFESRPPDKFGKGAVTMGDLLTSALRLRPDRIVVGEVRGGEAFDLMQAMNTGHGGSMATTHANTPTDTLRRLESLCLMSGVELPMIAVRAQVASGINVVITCERFHDGSRRTTHIAEVLPLNEKGDYRTQDIFVYTPVRKDADGKIIGYHAPTGIIPTFIDRCHAYGFDDLTEEFFDPATYGVPPPPIFNTGEGVKVRWAGSLKHREEGTADPESLQKPTDYQPGQALQPKPAPPKPEASEATTDVSAVPKEAPMPDERPKVKPPAEAEKLAKEALAIAATKAPEEDEDRTPPPEHDEPPAPKPAAAAAPPPPPAPAPRKTGFVIGGTGRPSAGVASAAPPRPASASTPAPRPAAPAPAPARAQPFSPPSSPHSNIELAPDLAEEAERSLPNDMTMKKGAILRGRAPMPPPPADEEDEPAEDESANATVMLPPLKLK